MSRRKRADYILNKKEELENEAYTKNIDLQVVDLPNSISGIYYEDKEGSLIAINQSIKAQSELCCVIAEELGHYYTSNGNLLTDKSVKTIDIRKQETRAKRWAYEKLVPLDKFIEAYNAHVENKHELAQFFGVTEEFLEESINHYKERYGLYSILGNHIIYFEPLGVLRIFT